MKTAMAFLVIVLTTMLFAQNTGTISGKITDKHTGYPISGTNVTVVGEKYSSSSNKAGFYEIKNIPVGIYKLKITHQEYKTKFIKKVKVSANSTSKINIELVNL
ncbi:MAG: carboxypeptidase regulatory-like domain-containing protein, partial [Calditrichia bacterium]|nr:carboxypeptidase regulatory-like domain-containing protein [Calditrichia bacterium]